jgi:pyridoxamine 5'-phosphate oxidase
MSIDDNPFIRFQNWMDEAVQSELNDPNAMSLATSSLNGIPSLRMVLLKGFDDKGFVFYTNLESQKGQELHQNPNAAICFHWKSLRRQVRATGTVEKVSQSEADHYFSTRPKNSQIGAWASKQSRPLKSRLDLEEEVTRLSKKYAIDDVPRPPHWSGFRLVPQRIEFWQDKAFRLHERLVFQKREAHWETGYLYP